MTSDVNKYSIGKGITGHFGGEITIDMARTQRSNWENKPAHLPKCLIFFAMLSKMFHLKESTQYKNLPKIRLFLLYFLLFVDESILRFFSLTLILVDSFLPLDV